MYQCYLKENKKLPLIKDLVGTVLCDMIKEDPRVLVFEADLARAGGTAAVNNNCPENFINCGIQEANMVGMAAASSESGAIPFTHTFGSFATRKTIDQIFMAACYPKMNLKMLGSDPGITASTNGGSHQAMEDMGIAMGLNNITLVEPSDGIMFEKVMRMMKDTYGVFYLRSHRKADKQIYAEDAKFEFGKGCLLREGTDATIIASGIEVEQAMIAADVLQEEGISVRVIDMWCWRPIDRELIIESAQKTGAIVTAENHVLATGLGSAVARVVAEECPVPMGYIGINEHYGEVGSVAFLMEKFKMDAASIADKVRLVIAKK